VASNLQEAREGKPALLIVDDDALIAETLAYALGADFEVYACDSRAHAIDLLRQLPQPPQLALVDLGLRHLHALQRPRLGPGVEEPRGRIPGAPREKGKEEQRRV